MRLLVSLGVITVKQRQREWKRQSVALADTVCATRRSPHKVIMKSKHAAAANKFTVFVCSFFGVGVVVVVLSLLRPFRSINSSFESEFAPVLPVVLK